jgi:hypothetical protein
VLCGDWNINLLEENTYQKALQILLLLNNLQNTVSSPTCVTPNTSSLLDVMIRNKTFYHSTTRVIEMGFSDHFALVMSIRVFIHSTSTCLKYVVKRFFSKRNILNFKDQLKLESWDEVYLQSDVNSAYCVFLSKFYKYFLHFFPIKIVLNKERGKSNWITEGIKVSRQRLQLL